MQLVRAFQVRGHYLANLDPLGLATAGRRGPKPQELTLEWYGFKEEDLDRVVRIPHSHIKGFLDADRAHTVRDIYKRLCETYSGTIGVECVALVAGADRAVCAGTCISRMWRSATGCGSR